MALLDADFSDDIVDPGGQVKKSHSNPELAPRLGEPPLMYSGGWWLFVVYFANVQVKVVCVVFVFLGGLVMGLEW